MRLIELNPNWVGAGGEGVSLHGKPMPERTGVAVSFDCPCGCDTRAVIEFTVAIDGGAWSDKGWARTGDTFDTLTLSPSILRAEPDGCKWHGWIRNGEVIAC